MKVLETTPFGFVLERESASCYREEAPSRVYLDGELHSESDKNILSFFGLEPGREYRVELRGPAGTQSCAVSTQKADYVIDVRDYNALGDGVHNDTAAISAAIYTAPANRSVVVFPRGRYRVDQVLLKSGVDLYLEEGAVLVQNADRDSLAILKGYQKSYDHRDAAVNSSWEGHPLDCFCSLVYGKDVENVRIYGRGELDGGGAEGGWWENPKIKNRAFRPRNLFLNHCARVAVMGIGSRNSAAWNIHPFYSEDLRFYDLTVANRPDSPNTDGLNPESCENVEIAGCRFRVGDDCIAVKSGKYYMGRRHFRRCRNIHIRGCLMEEGHGGVVIGSEIACGVENVTVRRCLFRRTDRGLRIKTRRGRGDRSVVRGVRVSDVVMDEVRHCFVVNMFYNCDPDGHSEAVRSKKPRPVGEETPAVRDIAVKRVSAARIGGSGAFLYGLPESPIDGVCIEDCRFAYRPGRGAECPAMMDDPVRIENLGIFAENVTGLRMEGNTFEGPFVNRIKGEGERDGDD